MKKLLKDTRGGGYFTPCVITIVIAMILSAVLFYAQCMTIIQATRADTERVLDHEEFDRHLQLHQARA